MKESRLDKILVDLGYVTEDQILAAFSQIAAKVPAAKLVYDE